MKTRKREKRYVEIRTKGENSLTAVGRPVVFNSVTKIFDDLEEVIAPGALDETIRDDDQRAIWNHNKDIVLGRKKSGTLRCSLDDKGLDVEIDFPDTEEGRSKLGSVERGDVDGMSFGFISLEETWTEREEVGITIYTRTITKMKLIEVSPCTFPQYDDTSIQKRSRDEAFSNIPEELTRDSGTSAEEKREAEFLNKSRELDLKEKAIL